MSFAETVAYRFVIRCEPILPPILLALVISAANSWWSIYQLAFDEGINLNKAALVAKGFSLYSQIWSDQPPLLTFLLAPVVTWFPGNVGVARAFTLAFCGLLLWSLFRIVYRLEGRTCAWLASAALLSIGAFQVLSVTVSVGLPALALATAAIDQCLVGATENKNWRYWIAGVLFSLSLQTKLFTGILFPSLILAAFVQKGSHKFAPCKMRAPKLAQMIFSAVVSFFTIAAISGEQIFLQLVAPHYNSGVANAYASQGGVWYLIVQLKHNIPSVLVALFLVAPFMYLKQATASRLIPAVWLASAVFVLSLHRPLWDHHLPLLYVPIAWLSALSIQLIDRHNQRLAVGIACILVLSTVGLRAAYKRHIREPIVPAQVGPTAQGEWIFPALLRSSSADAWVIADNGLDAVYADRLVPPELAVWSEKRLDGGYLPPERLISIVQKRQPEQILLRVLPQAPAFLDYIDRLYERVPLPQKEALYYIRRKPIELFSTDANQNNDAGSADCRSPRTQDAGC